MPSTDRISSIEKLGQYERAIEDYDETLRLRRERPNYVWAYDFVLGRTRDGRPVRLLTVIDEYTMECLAIRADRHIRP